MKAEASVRLQQLEMTQQVESSREQGLAVISHSGIPQQCISGPHSQTQTAQLNTKWRPVVHISSVTQLSYSILKEDTMKFGLVKLEKLHEESLYYGQMGISLKFI